jgi:hypothetical protein
VRWCRQSARTVTAKQQRTADIVNNARREVYHVLGESD